MKQFYLPTRIITGCGCCAELGTQASALGRRALLVCGARSLRASGRLDRALSLLQAAGVTTTVHDAISAEPTLDRVQEGLDRARAEQVEVVIGIGGGSAIDAAKAIAGLYTHPGTVREYFGPRTVSGGGLPWIAVPTTAGTGAEVTKNAVLISPEHDVKTSLRHDGWFASVALVDPELTLDTPPQITAASGCDALTQAIEAYTSIGAMPTTDALAIEAIARIGRSLERAWRDGQDLEARADMLYGSMLAGMAFSNARLGGVHGMAHPLGYRYGAPHGAICGLLLPYTMAYNVAYATHKYAQVARLLGVDTNGMDERTAAERAVERARELVVGVGLPTRLSTFGVRREDLAMIAQQSLPSSSLKHNPRPLAAHDVEAILSAAL
ncbi:MAG: iron-containing alcohol dehydrogenase [Anaerolineae bacterium]|nr:iron-containing alcohol dehydrogenase [Anaerolineae bacterium]